MFKIDSVLFKKLSVFSANMKNFHNALFYARKSAINSLKSGEVFNDKNLELHLLDIAEKIVKKHNFEIKSDVIPNNIGVLATTIYDVGGHSECIMRFVESFGEEYDVHTFVSNLLGDIKEKAPNKYIKLKQLSKVYEVSTKQDNYEIKFMNLLNFILDSKVKMLFVYIHMEDSVAAAVLAYLHQNTDIKIVFFNHADHTFSLGFEFNDLIIELRRQGQYITQNYRGKIQTALIPLQGTKKDDLKQYSREEIFAKKQELGINEDDFVSLSGFVSYKIFEGNDSPYFEFIKNLLTQEPKLKHVLISELSKKQFNIVKKIFNQDESLLNRLILISRQTDYDLLLQVGDVFLDSFPLGSALSHIDVIKNKRPTVIKKNKENELYTFYNYLYEGYEYAFEDTEIMVEKTLYLLRNKEEQQRIIDKAYQYYLDTYEFDVVKARYKEFIENSDDLSKFYNTLPKDYKCTIKSL